MNQVPSEAPDPHERKGSPIGKQRDAKGNLGIHRVAG